MFIHVWCVCVDNHVTDREVLDVVERTTAIREYLHRCAALLPERSGVVAGDLATLRDELGIDWLRRRARSFCSGYAASRRW